MELRGEKSLRHLGTVNQVNVLLENDDVSITDGLLFLKCCERTVCGRAAGAASEVKSSTSYRGLCSRGCRVEETRGGVRRRVAARSLVRSRVHPLEKDRRGISAFFLLMGTPEDDAVAFRSGKRPSAVVVPEIHLQEKCFTALLDAGREGFGHIRPLRADQVQLWICYGGDVVH